eukprot:CAMPEP_0194507010 /NCGR_PEP_ID=MMETSP0253-20130528/35844_1 /TAXON_ID=2966 /ORGANISM="Noctiluca scintillans" /LENGTH=117 /DNA_ID=CAMNT_0039349821 /DNA_START=38 /DNA_END=391 /DNA_ORIENTATION=+
MSVQSDENLSFADIVRRGSAAPAVEKPTSRVFLPPVVQKKRKSHLKMEQEQEQDVEELWHGQDGELYGHYTHSRTNMDKATWNTKLRQKVAYQSSRRAEQSSQSRHVQPQDEDAEDF